MSILFFTRRTVYVELELDNSTRLSQVLRIIRICCKHTFSPYKVHIANVIIFILVVFISYGNSDVGKISRFMNVTIKKNSFIEKILTIDKF